MKRHSLRRALACLLALLLLPLPSARADGAVGEMTVTCRDAFREDAETVVTVLEAADGYYITLAEAARMIGLIHAGGDYFAPNAHVSLRPDTSGLTSVTHGGETWYALEELMTALGTSILAADGALCYNALPINQDRLMEETERIMENGGYAADLLSNMPLFGAVSGVTTGFAFAFDVVWNQRFDVLTGEAYEDDIDALLLEVMGHHGEFDSLPTILANAMDTAEEHIGLVLKAQEAYETAYGAQDELLSGRAFLFGGAGCEPLYEAMEAVEALGDMGIKLSDLLSVTAYMYEVRHILTLYADALTRVLDSPEAWAARDTTIVRQSRQMLRVYEEHLENSRAQLTAEGILITAEDIANNLVENAFTAVAFDLPLNARLTKLLLEVADARTLNTLKKNDCVRSITMSAQIQDFFRAVYQGAATESPDAERSLRMRDAAMLYLKSAWVAYDSGAFDESIAGAIRRVQGQLDEELILLADFPDAMFAQTVNEPLPPGVLGFHSDKTAPVGDEARYHEAYRTFLRDGAYLGYVENAKLRQALYEGTGAGAYYLHDIDRDGADELLVWLGCSGADGEFQLFAGADGAVVHCGSAACDGSGLGVYGSDRTTGVYLSEYDGTGEILTSCDMVDGALLVSERRRLSPPDGWQPLEAAGSLPLREADAGGFGDAFEVTALGGTFLMTIPGAWGEGFLVKDDARGFTVYARESYETGFGGELFRVYMSEYTREEDIDVPNHLVLGCWAEGFLLVAELPLAAQFDLNDARQRELYQAMEADVPGVLASLRMLE